MAEDPFANLKKLQAERRLPPVERWQPKRIARIDIRIDRNGVWFHEGAPFVRPAMVRLLSSVLRREGNDYFLVTPEDKLAIAVEDAPFLAVEMLCRGQGQQREIGFRTSTDDVLFAGPGHPVWIAQAADGPKPYAHVRNGLNALIARPVYYALAELAEQADGHFWLRSRGALFDLGPIS